jgi:hypothetical protein
MQKERGPSVRRPGRGVTPLLVLLSAALLHCSSGSDSTEDGECFPDADGISGKPYTIKLTVDDQGFSKSVLNTENDSSVTLTLENTGTLSHGFELECVDVRPEFPNLPAGCPATSCFPAASTIAPLAPGESTTVTFITPTPDNLIYPFKSSAPDDASVDGLNSGQWSIM